MWRWLSERQLSPGQGLPLRGRITDYYDFLYGATHQRRQMDKILWTEVNGRSANYRQFDAA